MSSTEFNHGPYIIKTLQRNGYCRARVFRDEVWLHEVSDRTGNTVEDTVHRMRASLDALDDEQGEAKNEVQSYAQSFCKL